MAAVDKLLKFLNSKNVADLLDDEDVAKIVDDVIVGYDIDEDSRRNWLTANQEAMTLIKVADQGADRSDKEFPFYKSSKVIYPLLTNAIIQLSSRMNQHTVRNGRVAECTVLGQDEPEVDPQSAQPTGRGVKEAKAKRVSDFMSYEYLIESDTWLLDDYKMDTICAAWGVAFKECYYDPVTKSNCSELIAPENVIINHKVTSLDKCRRFTIRVYMDRNDIIEQQRAGNFSDFEVEQLDTMNMDSVRFTNDSREINPVYEIIKQFCFLDLDEDGYDEPYMVHVHKYSRTMLGIYPAFEINDINIDEKGRVLSIKPRHTLVDRHLIDDPEGGYYSLGMNHLLLHPAKSITAIQRQLLDAGTLCNTAATSGFITKAFKTKEKSLKFKLGEFKVLETPPGVDIKSQIFNLPFKEPSQVLLSLLQFLVETGKDQGFMTDVLTGDAQTQNVPATSMLAMVEQGTRAFKPIIEKKHQSLKKEFKIGFHLHSKYLDQDKYFRFQGQQQAITQSDFDESSMDIVPVADPTMSSEAHKFAKLQAMLQFMQMSPNTLDPAQAAKMYFTDLQFPNVDMLVAKPQPVPPDPKMIEVQMKAEIADKDHQIDQLKVQLAQDKLQLEALKVANKGREIDIKEKAQEVNKAKMIVDAHKENTDAHNQQRLTDIEEFNAETERQRIHVLEKQSRNKSNPSSS